MSDNNEQSKEFIFEHFADYKDTIIEWVINGDKDAQNIFLENYQSFEPDSLDFLEGFSFYFEKAFASCINNGEERAKEIVYKRPLAYNFIDHLFKLANEGDEKAQKIIIEYYPNPKEKNITMFSRQIPATTLERRLNKKINDFKGIFVRHAAHGIIKLPHREPNMWAINFVCSHIADFKQNILNFIDQEDHIHSINSDLGFILAPFIDTIIQLANNNNKDAFEIAKYFAEKEIFVRYLQIGDKNTIKDFIMHKYWPQKDRCKTRCAAYFIKHFLHDGDKDIKNFIYEHYDDYGFDACGGAWEIFDELEEDMYAVVPQICEFEELLKKWATNGDFGAKVIICNHFRVFSNSEKLLIEWAKEGFSKAIETIYNWDYVFRDFLDISELIIEQAKKGNDTAIRIACERYKDPNYSDCLIELAIQGNKEAINSICCFFDDFSSYLDWIKENGYKEYDKEDDEEDDEEDEFINCDAFSKILTHWAAPNDLDDRVKKFIYNHHNYLSSKDCLIKMAQAGDSKAKKILCENYISKDNLIKMALSGDQTAREVIYKNDLQFRDCIIELAKNDDKAKDIVRRNSYNVWRDLRNR